MFSEKVREAHSPRGEIRNVRFVKCSLGVQLYWLRASAGAVATGALTGFRREGGDKSGRVEKYVC